jgi:Fe-S-cluster containining protein
MSERANSLALENCEALPVHIQMRLAAAGPYAQAQADQASQALEPLLPHLRQELRAVQSPSLAPRAAMRRLRTLASEWGAVIAPLSACRSGCAHCCHIPLHISSLEAECIGSEIARTPAAAPKKLKPIAASYANPCPFLVESKCSIYESRPLVCRTHFNMDSDDLLCRLVDGTTIPVPYADARSLQLTYWKISHKGRIADIRSFFPVAAR